MDKVSTPTDLDARLRELIDFAEGIGQLGEHRWLAFARAAAAIGAEVEREECAKVAEQVGEDWNHIAIARHIRARGSR